MYAKLCKIEILSSYIRDVSVGDVLTIQALVTNPLDWQHFYEKLADIKKGERTDFTVVTREGDRVIGYGDVSELEKWSDKGKFGFKIKVDISKQKSLTDRRVRGSGKLKALIPEEIKSSRNQNRELLPSITSRATGADITIDDITAFTELLKDSVTMDIPSQPASTSKTSSA